MDVTDIVKGWLSGSRPNDGFMIKRADSDESSNEEHGRISFFSMDTNTIFPPKLEFAWDDTSFSTGSLSELTSEDNIVYFKNLRREYVSDSEKFEEKLETMRCKEIKVLLFDEYLRETNNEKAGLKSLDGYFTKK